MTNRSIERLPTSTTNRLKTRDDGCCSVNFLKYVLHIYNVILFLSGIAVGGIGIWTILDKHDYNQLLPSLTYPILAYVLIAAGLVALISSCLGCGGVSSENRCYLLLYIFLVMGIFLMEVGVGIFARLYEEQLGPELHSSLNKTFSETYSIEPEETAIIDQMQQEFKCCGAVRFEDWAKSNWYKNDQRNGTLVPESCCKSPKFRCGQRDHPSNIHYSGCIYKFLEFVKAHLIVLGAVGFGVSVLEVFGMILGTCLIRRRDSGERQVGSSRSLSKPRVTGLRKPT